MISAERLSQLANIAKQLADAIVDDGQGMDARESCARLLAQVEFIATRYSERKAHEAHAEAMTAAAAASEAKRAYYESRAKLAEQPSYFAASYITGGDEPHIEED